MNFVVYEYALALGVKKQRAVVRHRTATGRHVRWVHRCFPFDGPRKEWVPETDHQRRGKLCELRILERKRRGRLRPDEKVWFFRSRGEADSSDFVEIRGVRLKPIRGVRFHFREIELHGAREMMCLRPWHQARPRQRGTQQDCRCSNSAGAPPAECQRVRCARPGEQCIETRSEEHTSELQSQSNLVCRLLLEKKRLVRYARLLLDRSFRLDAFGSVEADRMDLRPEHHFAVASCARGFDHTAPYPPAPTLYASF